MTVASINGSVGAVSAAPSQEIDTVRKPKDPGELDKMARQFEAVFVRRMLERTSIAKSTKNSALQAMVVDAMADAVTAGRGMGFAQQIKDALSQARAIQKEQG